MILGALDDAGGQAYLARQAEENPGPFMALVGKVLPTQISGDPDHPLVAVNISAEALAEMRDRLLAKARNGSA